MKIDAILGFPLFRETLLTLDYPRSRVVLQPASTPAPVPGTAVPLDDTNKTPLIHIHLGDRTFVALLDSGSDSPLSLNPVGLNPRFANGPRTGATVHVKPKRLAFFKVGKELRERVNERRGSVQAKPASEPVKLA